MSHEGIPGGCGMSGKGSRELLALAEQDGLFRHEAALLIQAFDLYWEVLAHPLRRGNLARLRQAAGLHRRSAAIRLLRSEARDDGSVT